MVHRATLIAFLLLLVSGIVSANDFKCTVKEGVYKTPGSAELDDASHRDQSVIGAVFYVRRDSGEIVGSSPFDNGGDVISVLRNIDEIINTVEIMSKNDQSDVKLLKVDELYEKLTFKYYFGWLGLLLTGDCSDA